MGVGCFIGVLGGGRYILFTYEDVLQGEIYTLITMKIQMAAKYDVDSYGFLSSA